MSEFEQDPDGQLASLATKKEELHDKCSYVSCGRVANEIRRLSKTENRLVPYIRATFTLMNNSHTMLDTAQGRDASIEMISILESEDRARAIQPDLDQSEYEYYIHAYSSCSYDNLAKATGMMNGYNSDGMHDCIADGINVCRRTGKLRCIVCFREYATDVYAAADDLEMAMHYARVGMANTNRGPHDRRYVGAKDLIRLQILQGELQGARETVMKMREFAEIWHSPLAAQLGTDRVMRKIGLLSGEPEKWESLCTQESHQSGEAPFYDFENDELAAIKAICDGKPLDAIEILEKWDRELQERNVLHEWFGNRLQLIIAHQFAGNADAIERLAGTLKDKAEKARDYLTLRCLNYILDPTTAQTPVPAVAPMDSGPFAASPEVSAAETQSPTNDQGETENSQTVETPSTEAERIPPEDLQVLMMRMAESRNEAISNPGEESFAKFAEEQDGILAELLEMSDEARDATRTCFLLHFANFVTGDGTRSADIWAWARKLIANHRTDATALSLFAKLGASLRFGQGGELVEKQITESQLEKMFRDSLDMDPDNAKNYGRAGDYFRFLENLGEAERCYARSFRLDRSNSETASSLAEIYRRTERERDALVVLDMAIRESESPEPDLFWQSAILAHSIDQHDSALTYLDAYEKVTENAPWLNYYRASSLLKLDRNEEAAVAAKTEFEINPDAAFPSAVHTAIASMRLSQPNADQLVEAVLDFKLGNVETMSPAGLASLFEMFWSAIADRSADDPLKSRCRGYLLAASMAPDQMFQREGEPVEGLTYFRIELTQPVGEEWPELSCCLAHEKEIAGYRASWGVLAKDEDEAVALALNWQEKSYSGLKPESVVATPMDDSRYTDQPGIVWQGFREGLLAEA